jgi:hypothetical protein
MRHSSDVQVKILLSGSQIVFMTFRKFSTAPGFLCRDLSAIAEGGRGSISPTKYLFKPSLHF